MGKLSFLRNSTARSVLLIKTFLGLVEVMFGLVNVSFSQPEWQAVKMTFFTPWFNILLTSLKGPVLTFDVCAMLLIKRSSSDNYNYSHCNLEIACSELSLLKEM